MATGLTVEVDPDGAAGELVPVPTPAPEVLVGVLGIPAGGVITLPPVLSGVPLGCEVAPPPPPHAESVNVPASSAAAHPGCMLVSQGWLEWFPVSERLARRALLFIEPGFGGGRDDSTVTLATYLTHLRDLQAAELRSTALAAGRRLALVRGSCGVSSLFAGVGRRRFFHSEVSLPSS